MVSTNSLKNGMTLLIDGKLKKVVAFQHVKPGKGPAFVRTTLKEVETGKVVDNTFRAGQDVEQAFLEKKTLQYLYRDGEDFQVMNAETYEQRSIPAAAIGDNAHYMVEGETIDVMEYEGRIVGVDLPASVELEVSETEPGLAGDTAGGGATKPATLSTGLEIQVPLFIEPGEKIKVDTRSGEYMSRA